MKGPSANAILQDYFNDRYADIKSVQNLEEEEGALAEEIRLRSQEVKGAEENYKSCTSKAIEKGKADLEALTSTKQVIKSWDSGLNAKDHPIHQLQTYTGHLTMNIGKYYELCNKYEYEALKTCMLKLIREFDAFYNEKKDGNLVIQFERLTEDWYMRFKCMKGVKNEIKSKSIPYTHLYSWIYDSLRSIESKLSDKLSRMVKNKLEAIHWPCHCEGEDHQQLMTFLSNLIMINYLSDGLTIDHALDLLVASIQLKFQFHFSGDRSTCRQDKIEWYFHYATDLLRSHSKFILEDLQTASAQFSLLSDIQPPLKDQYIEKFIGVFTKVFISNYQQTVHSADLGCKDRGKWMINDYLSEAMQFDLLLLDEYSYQTERGSFIYITQKLPNVIRNWIELEKDKTGSFLALEIGCEDNWSTSGAKSILSEGLFNSLTASDDFVLASFELFVHMIDELSDVYYDIPDPLISSQIYESVLRPLLKRFFGMAKHKTSEAFKSYNFSLISMIFGSLEFLCKSMDEWNEDEFFTNLWQFHNDEYGPSDETSKKPLGVYSNTVNKMKESITDQLYEIITHDIYLAFDSYRLMNFSMLDILIDTRSCLYVSENMGNFCQFIIAVFRSIVAAFHCKIQTTLNAKLLVYFENLLLNDILLAKHMNLHGVKQFEIDLHYFISVLEGCNLSHGVKFIKVSEALILMDSVEGDKTLNVKEMVRCMEERLPIKSMSWIKSLGILHLNVSECRKILLLKSSPL